MVTNTCRATRPIALQHPLEELSGVAGRVFGNLLGGAFGDDGAAAIAALWAHVDDMIGVFDNVQVVFDDDHAVAGVYERVQNV